MNVMLDASLRIVAVAGIAALMLRLWHVRTGAVRHMVWTLVLAAMLSMPLLPTLLPAIQIAVPIPGDRVTPVSTSDFANARIGPERAFISSSLPAPSPTAPTVSGGVSNGATAAIDMRISAATAISFVYFIGLVGMLLTGVAGWMRARHLSRTATPVALHCSAPVRESSFVSTPLVAGVLRPTIIVPTEWRTWSHEKLQACLAHELAHIRRRDPLVSWIAYVNRSVFWFHPLAWWLQCAIATSAEEAADAAALREIADRRSYAAFLLDIADTVRQRGGRVAWHGVGVRGIGSFERRIDRVLHGDDIGETSTLRKATLITSCAAVVGLAAACQPQVQTPPAPLQPDPEVASRIERQKQLSARVERARTMTAADVTALEASLKRSAEDLEALKTLQWFYRESGAKVLGWNEMIARRRPHIVWLIENYPERDEALWFVSADADPIGYGEAKKRWLAQTTKPEASEAVLLNAAAFFAGYDPQIAERLLLRARSQAPQDRVASISAQLGRLYADVINGRRNAQPTVPSTPTDADSYRREVQRRLAASADARLLTAAGEMLIRNFRDVDRRQLGLRTLERALQLDPSLVRVRRTLESMQYHDQAGHLDDTLHLKAAELIGGEILGKVRRGVRLDRAETERLEEAAERALVDLPVADRAVMLSGRADVDYSMAEYWDWTKQTARAAAQFERSKTSAQDALTLAPQLGEHPDHGYVVYMSNVVLSAHALREGNGQASLKYLRAASVAPSSSRLERTTAVVTAQQLTNYLLKLGEREAVADFLERSAKLRTWSSEQLLRDAAAIRAGKMPLSYQYMVSRQ